MDVVILDNNFLIVKIKKRGAELASIFSKENNCEYLWQAGKEWPKQAPVLFPIVGQLKENKYFFDGNEYSMERHGFARNKDFEIQQTENNFAAFVLKSDYETLKIFPFEFQLTIRYRLIQNRLIVSHLVENASMHEMFFSIGTHPAFKIPLRDPERYDEYYLEFSEKETAPRWLLQNGLIDKPEFFFQNHDILPLTKELFYNDALVFKNLKSDMVSIKSKNHKQGLHFCCSGFPYFGIWAAKDADFICLEPWHGIADNTKHNQQLKEKEGIIKLISGEKFNCQYEVQIF